MCCFNCALPIWSSVPSHSPANNPYIPPFLDTEPPVIDRCRSPPTVQATDAETAAVIWEVPQFSDNSGMSGRCAQTADA